MKLLTNTKIILVIHMFFKETIIMEERVSEKIREFRLQKKMTLKGLSERTGLSVGFLSQVERGISSMTIVTLSKIASALEVNMKDLVNFEVRKSFVNRKDNQLLMRMERSFISYIRLNGEFDDRKMEPLIMRVKPGTLEAEECLHDGEEFYYVIKVKAVFIIEDIEHIVCEGESIHYPSNIKHKTLNREDEELVMLNVTIPLIF
jgi:transcriptional regulator with XRE-family HTH domain